jgi:hypothetical protein
MTNAVKGVDEDGGLHLEDGQLKKTRHNTLSSKYSFERAQDKNESTTQIYYMQNQNSNQDSRELLEKTHLFTYLTPQEPTPKAP